MALHKKTGEVVPFGTAFAVLKEGKLATNAHVAKPVSDYLKAGLRVSAITPGGTSEVEVTNAIWHPEYIDWAGGEIKHQTPDVGVITVRTSKGEPLPMQVELASDEELTKLAPGTFLCYAGFPVWTTVDYNSRRKIEPELRSGSLTRLTTFQHETAQFSNQFLLQHDLIATGGASGSPIFNRDGKVVAIYNSGQEARLGEDLRIPFGRNFAIRIDLLRPLLK